MNGDNPFYGGGGGYMSPGSPLGSGGGSPSGSGRRAASHSLRPVTLKQLVDATQEHADADWKIGDVEISQVTIVAHVISVTPQTTNCVFLLRDGTAQFEARQWIDAQASSEEDRITESTYVRVLGTLKAFGQKRYITASHIKEIPQSQVADELFFHILEAATTTLIFERGPPPRPSEGSLMHRPSGGATASTSAYTAQSYNTGASHPQFAGLPILQKQIVEFMITQPQSDQGIHVKDIATHLANVGQGSDAHTISSALEELMDAGHVYTTTDDSHFCVSL